jgi:hypothetical protein
MGALYVVLLLSSDNQNVHRYEGVHATGEVLPSKDKGATFGIDARLACGWNRAGAGRIVRGGHLQCRE